MSDRNDATADQADNATHDAAREAILGGRTHMGAHRGQMRVGGGRAKQIYF